MKTELKVSAFVVMIFMLASCNPFRQVVSVRIVHEPEAQFRPGASIPFGVVSMDKRGRRKSTKGYTRGKVSLDKYEIMVDGGWQDESNIVIDTLVEGRPEKYVKVRVTVPDFPKLTDSVVWKLTYEGETSWYFNGAPGESGKRGKARLAPVRIGGTALVDGNPGQSGGDGGSGHDLDIYVVRVDDSSFYMQHGYFLIGVKVIDKQTGATKLTYVQEKYGRLKIFAEGGSGGEGGNGGPGSDGRSTEAGRMPGNGADGGRGGQGGQGGRGGRVRIFIDSANRDFLTQLQISNKGGSGGTGGLGGRAGQGGTSADGRRGADGMAGSNGMNGNWGENGEKPEIIWGPVSLN